MHILFVHGMGRTPISGMPVLLRLSANGYSTSVFGYSTALENFDAIRNRLLSRILKVAPQGKYVLIGHSLGGVLLRSALSKLPQGVNPPEHLFLLGSPIRSARMARGLRKRCLYRALTGDCGQLLASNRRMNAIGSGEIQTTSIIGTKGFNGQLSPFSDAPNDGVVAASELHADWITDEVYVPVIHTLLPASCKVSDVLLNRLEQITKRIRIDRA